jgi:hypothetical protein
MLLENFWVAYNRVGFGFGAGAKSKFVTYPEPDMAIFYT